MADTDTPGSGGNDSKRKQPRTRLVYLRDSPPPSAGAGPGQWRRALGKGLTAGRASQDSDLDVISLSVDVGNVSLDFKDGSSAGGASSDRSVSNNNNKHNVNNNNKFRGRRRAAGSGGRSAGVVATPRTPADPLVFNGKWTRRSTSNRLLNCFTIDDCMARYRTRLALGHGGPEAWATAKAELAYTLETFPNPRRAMESASDAGGDVVDVDATPRTRRSQRRYPGASTGRYSPGGGSRETSFDDEAYLEHLQGGAGSDLVCNNDNEALTKAMRTILTTTEVVNNTARTGLFRRSTKPRRSPPSGAYPGQAPHTPNGRPESSRFRKRNETLHKWIDDEIILPRSRLGSMNSVNSMGGSDGGGGQHRPGSTTPPRSSTYRGPRSMEQPDTARRRPARPETADDDDDPSAPGGGVGGGVGDPGGTLEEAPRGPHRSDSFLEMLMELDEDKRSAVTGPSSTAGGETDTLQGSVVTASTDQVGAGPGGD